MFALIDSVCVGRNKFLLIGIKALSCVRFCSTNGILVKIAKWKKMFQFGGFV